MNEGKTNQKILVSACLYGKCTRYDGKCSPITHPSFESLKQRGLLVPVCPEVLGGLSTPRIPSEIKDGEVINRLGDVVTKQFVRGARCALQTALQNGIKTAILKDNSPSCGSTHIYDGSFSGRKIRGEGVFAKMLRENGITVLTENDTDKLCGL